MAWSIEYPYSDVEEFILDLPPKMAAKYLWLTELMQEFGANLGLPHTRAMSGGLFELRIKRPGRNWSGFLLHAGRTTNRNVARLHQEVADSTIQRIAYRKAPDGGGICK